MELSYIEPSTDLLGIGVINPADILNPVLAESAISRVQREGRRDGYCDGGGHNDGGYSEGYGDCHHSDSPDWSETNCRR